MSVLPPWQRVGGPPVTDLGKSHVSDVTTDRPWSPEEPLAGGSCPHSPGQTGEAASLPASGLFGLYLLPALLLCVLPGWLDTPQEAPHIHRDPRWHPSVPPAHRLLLPGPGLPPSHPHLGWTCTGPGALPRVCRAAGPEDAAGYGREQPAPSHGRILPFARRSST